MPGPSVFPSGEPGVSGDFWARGEGERVLALESREGTRAGFPAATRERPRASFFIALSPDSTTMTREQSRAPPRHWYGAASAAARLLSLILTSFPLPIWSKFHLGGLLDVWLVVTGTWQAMCLCKRLLLPAL